MHGASWKAYIPFDFDTLGPFLERPSSWRLGWGQGALTYLSLKNMCRCEKSGLQAVASGI